jgi:hypothetical protein
MDGSKGRDDTGWKVDKVTHHESLRNTRLAIEYSTHRRKFLDEGALNLMRLILGNTHVSANPAYVAHGRVHAFDMELVLETHREAVEGTDGLSVFGKVAVKKLCPLEGNLRKVLVETVALQLTTC